MYELQCIFDSRQSFYGKAQVEIKQYDNFIATILYSYGTEVASIEEYNNSMKIYFYNGKYSQTTTRHQKEFFKQKGLSEKELKKLFENGQLKK